MQADTPSLANYTRMLGDPFYFGVLWTSVSLSAAGGNLDGGAGLSHRLRAGAVAVALGAWSMLALILLSAFVTIAIKIYGLMILFAADGGAEPRADGAASDRARRSR